MFWSNVFETSRKGERSRILVTLLPWPRCTDVLSKKAEIPVYSFEQHARLGKTTTIYSPHVLILEGIFALHDKRVLDMLDLKVWRLFSSQQLTC